VLPLVTALVSTQLRAARPSQRQRVALNCPDSVRRPGPTAPELALQAARRDISRTFHLTNQNGPVRLVPTNYNIDEVVKLNAESIAPDARLLYREAARRCGAIIASRSFAVAIDIPVAQSIASGQAVAFFAPVRGHWRIWYHRFGKP